MFSVVVPKEKYDQAYNVFANLCKKVDEYYRE